MPDQRLSDEDYLAIVAVVKQMVQVYYPRSYSDKLQSFVDAFAQLARRTSVSQVAEVLHDFLIRPDQKFLPRPSEVAAEIERRYPAPKPVRSHAPKRLVRYRCPECRITAVDFVASGADLTRFCRGIPATPPPHRTDQRCGAQLLVVYDEQNEQAAEPPRKGPQSVPKPLEDTKAADNRSGRF